MTYENSQGRTVMDMMRDPIFPEDFDVPEQHAKAAQNYANYMLAKVTAERDALRADADDAARYRWIRDGDCMQRYDAEKWGACYGPGRLDAAIDSARSKESPHE